MTDHLVRVADRLLTEGHITHEQRSLLVTDAGEVIDNSRFPVDVCDNGDVFIHNRGAYPIILKGYGSTVE